MSERSPDGINGIIDAINGIDVNGSNGVIEGNDGNDVITLAQAAGILEVSESTVRRLVESGKLAAATHRGPTGHRRHLLNRADVERLLLDDVIAPTRRTMATTASTPSPSMTPSTSSTSSASSVATTPSTPSSTSSPAEEEQALRERLAAAEAKLESERELRERAEGEVRFLREQLTATQSAGHEFRVLLGQHGQLLAEINEREKQRALPAPKRPWWRLWD
jgi:excisionase family DNA binding protein